MYVEKLPEILKTTTIVKIKYDCCEKLHELKWKDADKNYQKNGGKHICRPCWLKTDNPATKQEVQDKIKQTTLEKYGVSCVLNTKENTKNRVESMFGTEERIEEIVAKRKQTSLERYGTESPMQNEEIKLRQHAVIMEKYGVDVPLKNPDILAKMKNTLNEKYGVDNVGKIPEAQEKASETMLQRYGVKRYNQLPKMREYFRENCREWLSESWANPWAKGIKRPQEWNDKNRNYVKKVMDNGTWWGGFTNNLKGRFPSSKCKKKMPRFLSSLELQYHFFLEFNDQVSHYDYEGLVIEYRKKDDTLHDYYVDFQVWYKDDPIQHNFELKHWKNKDKEDVIAKQEAALKFCNDNNMTYTLLFTQDIESLGLDLEEVKKYPNIEWQSK